MYTLKPYAVIQDNNGSFELGIHCMHNDTDSVLMCIVQELHPSKLQKENAILENDGNLSHTGLNLRAALSQTSVFAVCIQDMLPAENPRQGQA